MERRLHTLVEVVDQVEGSSLIEEGEELEKLVFPRCGEIFSQLRYKVTMCAFVTQKYVQVVREERKSPAAKLRGEDEP